MTLWYLTLQMADLAAGPITKTAEREEIVAFTEPILSVQMTALVHIDNPANTLQALLDNKGKSS